MEFKDLFVSMGIVLIGIIAIFGVLNTWNDHYGTNVDGGLNTTKSNVQTLLNNNLSSVSQDTISTAKSKSGSATTDSEEGLIKKSLNTIKRLYALIDIVPTVLSEGAQALGISPAIVEVGKWIFGFCAVVTLAYLLLLGVRRLL